MQIGRDFKLADRHIARGAARIQVGNQCAANPLSTGGANGDREFDIDRQVAILNQDQPTLHYMNRFHRG